jgi:uncharacterized membrane protein
MQQRDHSRGGHGPAGPGGTDEEDPLARLSKPDAAESWHIVARLRNYFLTGLVIVGPVTITIYIVWWFVNVVDAWVKPFVPRIYNPDTYLPFQLPGIGVVFGIFGLMLIGALAANLIGRTLVSYSEMMVGRMPIVRNVYRGLKQIFETVLTQKGGTFKQVALIEFPAKGLWSVVFVAAEAKGEIQDKIGNGNPMVGVFLPTVPPTTGYVVYVDRKDIVFLDMSVEDAAKLLLSAGLVMPEYYAKTAELAAAAGRNGQYGPPSIPSPPEADDPTIYTPPAVRPGRAQRK